MLVIVISGLVFNSLSLINVVIKLVASPGAVKPTPLFYSSLAIWTGNFLIFSLLYWLVDRGGPFKRAEGIQGPVDFNFPAMDAAPPRVAPNWQPSMVDYLFLAFTTATAFSPTEAIPLSSRAKVLMMIESAISLLTIAVVAARTVNILQ